MTVADSVAVPDTLKARALPRTGGGDSTVTANIYWTSFDTTILALPDSTRGVFVGRQPGNTDIEAYTGNVRSNPIAITVYTPTGPARALP